MDISAAIARVRKDTRLSHLERLLYIFLTEIVEEQGGSIHMSLRALSLETSISAAALVDCIPRLRDLGYIRASKLPGKSGHETYLVLIADLPEPKPVQIMEAKIDGVRVTIRVEKE